MKELIDAYEEYVTLLENSESELLGFTATHGVFPSKEDIKRGEELRNIISKLKTNE